MTEWATPLAIITAIVIGVGLLVVLEGKDGS